MNAARTMGRNGDVSAPDQDYRETIRDQARFLSYLTHDVRGQLNAISLTLELLILKLKDRPELEEELADSRSLQRALTDTADGMQRLIAFRHLGDPSTRAEREEICIRQLSHEIITQFARPAREKGIDLVLAMPQQAAVETDRKMLRLILQNLVGNAIKYSTRGTVTLSAVLTDGQWSIAVADQGSGIATERQAGIFTEFTRGPTHGQPGLGLGLAIAHQAARLMGANLSIESEVGVGTTFRIVLPKAHQPRQ